MKKVLIVIDMQNDFINGALGTPEAQAIVPAVVNKIKSLNKDDYLFLTRDTHYCNYLNTFEGKNLPVEHCIKNTLGWEINEDVMGAADRWYYEIINKPTFGSTELVETLINYYEFNTKEIEFELCGLCTDICVASNALLLRAYFPDIPITIDSTCCAGVTSQSHEAALITMKMCQINVI